MVRRLTENALRVIVRMIREERDRYRKSCREEQIDGEQALALMGSAVIDLQKAESLIRNYGSKK